MSGSVTLEQMEAAARVCAANEKDIELEHKNIFEALSAAQGELKNPEKTKTADAGKYKYKYADIADVLECVLPVLSKHGLSVTQPTSIKDGSIILLTKLHFNDQTIESEYPVCSLNGNHQAMGAALTYARRYALTTLVGVAAVDDSDGSDAAPVGDGGKVKITASQAKTEINWEAIQKKIDESTTFKALDNHEERIEQRKGTWPDTYYWKAKERVTFNRLELADQRLSAITDADELANEYADLEAILEKKIPDDELVGLYRKHEERILS